MVLYLLNNFRLPFSSFHPTLSEAASLSSAYSYVFLLKGLSLDYHRRSKIFFFFLTDLVFFLSDECDQFYPVRFFNKIPKWVFALVSTISFFFLFEVLSLFTFPGLGFLHIFGSIILIWDPILLTNPNFTLWKIGWFLANRWWHIDIWLVSEGFPFISMETLGNVILIRLSISTSKIQASGIAAMDIKKLKDAGLCTVESVAYSPRKDLLHIKGISDAKVDKIVEAGTFYCLCCFWSPFNFIHAFEWCNDKVN